MNSDTCSQKGFNPSFLCQSFGLSTRADFPQVSDALCIPLRSGKGLQDLTVRCAKAFNEDFLPQVQALDTAVLAEIQEQVKAGIAEMEAARCEGDIGILAYCDRRNALNKGRQKSECAALQSIMDKFKTEVRTIAAAAAEEFPQGSRNTTPPTATETFPGEEGQQ